jgi:hypothetical protein
MMSQTESAEGLYLKRTSERATYLEEAHRSALVTIPSITPDQQDICQRSEPVILPKPFQSLGARGVNNLSSKLLLTLLPPTAPFMKYELTGETRDAAEAEGAEITELKSKLARREMRVQAEVDKQGIRNQGFQILRRLLIEGNVMAYAHPSEGGLKVFAMCAYTVKRDGEGNLLDLIYVEKLDRTTIDDERLLAMIAESDPSAMADKDGDPIFLYTRVLRQDRKTFKSWQEFDGRMIEGTEETHNAKTLPWLVLRYTSIDGEDYGRGFVEEYRGDLTSFEQMSRDMVFASANAAKVVWAVDPASPTKFKKFAEVPNGGAVSAGPNDITAIRLDKGGDMNVVLQQMASLSKDLSADFLLNSSFQRQQERVTAEEIRRMAEELEDTLGGVFSLLSQEFQLPLARLLEAYLIKTDKTFQRLPEGATSIGVVTGLAAIGRGQDLQRLREGMALLGEMAQISPGIVDYVKESDLNTRIWNGSGVDTEGLLYTEEEVGEIRSQRARAAAQKTVGEDMSSGAGQAIGTVGGNMDPEQMQEMIAQATQQTSQG